MNKFMRLFTFFLSALDVYVWKPLFWLLIVLLLSGLEEISELRKGNFYVSKRNRIVNAISLIFISLFFFWYYWFKPFMGITTIAI